MGNWKLRVDNEKTADNEHQQNCQEVIDEEDPEKQKHCLHPA